MFLPVFCKIQKDEYFPAWIADLASLNGFSLRYTWDYLGNVSISPFWQHSESLSCRNIYQFSLNNRFPTADDLLRYHTDYYIKLPFYRYSEQAGRLAAILYDDRTYQENSSRAQKYKYCPICAETDMKEHYRFIAHTPHQLADACYIHGVKLVTDPFADTVPEPADEEEIRSAVFINELYQKPVFTDLAQLIKAHGKKNNFGNAYLTSPDAAIKNMTTIINNYRTCEDFRNAFPGGTPLYNVYCPLCRKSYLQHKWIPTCPICDMNDNIAARTQKRLPDYMTAEMKGGTCLIHHNNCGITVSVRSRSALWVEHTCSNCEKYTVSYWDKKLRDKTTEFKVIGVQKDGNDYRVLLNHVGHDHTIVRGYRTFHTYTPIICEKCKMEELKKKYVGKKKLNKEGEEMEIIDYFGHENITVRVGDRIIENARFQDFRNGKLLSHAFADDIKNKYIGQKIYNKKYGMWLEITGYKDAYHAEATFEDGYVARNCRIVSLLKGKCQRSDDLEFRKKKYIGLTSYNETCGQNMVIIDYLDAFHITVRFDDGTVVTNVRLAHFRKGLIKKPNIESKIGLTNLTKEGHLITITGYRRSDDLDVTFEDGTIVEHRSMQAFRTGSIRYPLESKYVGMTNTARNGMKMKIIAYHNNRNIDIEFEDGTRVYGKTLDSFHKGKIGHPHKKKKSLR